MNFKVKWIDCGREPRCAPNPAYPDGIDIDVSDGKVCCSQTLPYPAPRCGLYFVECKQCGANAMITTAGRRDDPRSVKLPCQGAALAESKP